MGGPPEDGTAPSELTGFEVLGEPWPGTAAGTVTEATGFVDAGTCCAIGDCQTVAVEPVEMTGCMNDTGTGRALGDGAACPVVGECTIVCVGGRGGGTSDGATGPVREFRGAIGRAACGEEGRAGCCGFFGGDCWAFFLTLLAGGGCFTGLLGGCEGCGFG